MSRFLVPELAACQPYTPGEQPRDRRYIKLNTNESPYPPSPAVCRALEQAGAESLRLYPDPECRSLTEAAAAFYGLRPEQVMPGNGSDEVLFFALRAFCGREQGLAFADVTYGCYAVWCGLLGLVPRIVPLRPDFTLEPEDYFGLGQTRVIANPNAPTGLALTPAQVERILQEDPDHVLILDEAYVDFGAESCVPLIHRYKNLLVVQTFSKSRQLAGARLGLALGDPELIADLNRVKFSLNPYNINRLTLAAGCAALADREYFDRTRRAIIRTRTETAAALRRRGFALTDSCTNFLFASPPGGRARELCSALRDKGVLVRYFDAPRTARWMRITVGTPQEMEALLAAIDEIFAQEDGVCGK